MRESALTKYLNAKAMHDDGRVSAGYFL